MEDCMPVSHSGARASGKIEVKAVQRYRGALDQVNEARNLLERPNSDVELFQPAWGGEGACAARGLRLPCHVVSREVVLFLPEETDRLRRRKIWVQKVDAPMFAEVGVTLRWFPEDFHSIVPMATAQQVCRCVQAQVPIKRKPHEQPCDVLENGVQ